MRDLAAKAAVFVESGNLHYVKSTFSQLPRTTAELALIHQRILLLIKSVIDGKSAPCRAHFIERQWYPAVHRERAQ